MAFGLDTFSNPGGFASPTALRLAASAKLYSLLARMFSYPDRIEAQAYVSSDFLEICEGFVEEAGYPDRVDAAVREAFVRATEEQGLEACGTDLRVEYTRLFTAPPRPVSLVGSKWVHSRTLVSEQKGERYAVGQVYRELGLRNRASVHDPADHLVSELDFLFYVMRAESRAWRSDDLVMARDWRQLRDDFLTYHLRELAFGVSDAVGRMSKNAHMRYFAALLRLVVSNT